jgi:hypothetical protein
MYSKKSEVVLNTHKDHEVICIGVNEITYKFLLRVAKGLDLESYLEKNPGLKAIMDTKSITIKNTTIYWDSIVSIFDASKMDKDFESIAIQPRTVGACAPISNGTVYYWDYYRDRFHYYHVGLYSWKESWTSLLTALNNPTHLIAFKRIKNGKSNIQVPELSEESNAKSEA